MDSRRDLQKVCANAGGFTSRYTIDELAAEMGHVVLRLPPYHCELNPIELIWSNIKRRVKLRNNTFKLKDVEVLVHTAIAEINHQMWKNNIRHVIKIEADYRVRYCHDRFHLRDHDYCGAAVSAAVHAGEADVPSASSRTAFLPNFHFCVSTDTDPTT